MFKNRITKLQSILKKEKLDSLFITNPTNIYYLSGFRSSVPTEREVTALLTKHKLHLFVPEMYRTEAEELEKNSKVQLVIKNKLFSTPTNFFEGDVGFESTNIKFVEYDFLKENSKNKLVPTKNMIEELRVIKDTEEIKLIRKAVEITDKTFSVLTKKVRRGMTEKEVAKLIENTMESLGAEELSFPSIVASGKGSALPHYRTSNKKIGYGPLLIDMGARYKGYCGDMTRVLYVGKPTKEFKEKYELVLKTEIASIEGTKPNVTEEELWKIAAEKLGGEPKNFINAHSLGHGIGLDPHEAPSIWKGMKRKLKPGMVITIEPAIYDQDWGGIRIEDYCLITDDGVEVLSTSTKDIISLK